VSERRLQVYCCTSKKIVALHIRFIGRFIIVALHLLVLHFIYVSLEGLLLHFKEDCCTSYTYTFIIVALHIRFIGRRTLTSNESKLAVKHEWYVCSRGKLVKEGGGIRCTR